MTKSIFLTNGKECLVDDEDYQWASRYKWCENDSGYAVSHKQRMHREILKAPKSMEVDHINGDKLDNRRSNLRFATHQENSWNRSANKNNKLDFKGVSKVNRRFRAVIIKDKRQIHLGYFDTALEAALARDKAEKEMRGEFACLNFSEVPA